MFDIKVGDFDLLESGSIITMKDADIQFKIKGLEYVLRFVNTEEGKAKIQMVSNDGKRLVLELQNFNDPIGGGNISPLPMGVIEGKQVFLLFRISQLEDGGKTMFYSWLSKPVVTVTINKKESHVE